MLDRTFLPGEEARVRYDDADLVILRPGRFVRCAVTRDPIPLEELRYWNVDRQEAYRDVETAFKRWQELRKA